MKTIPPAQSSPPAIPSTIPHARRDWLAEALRCEEFAARGARAQSPSHPYGTATRAAGA